MSDEIASSDAVGIDAFEAAAVSGEAEQPDAPEFDDDDFDTVEEAEDFEPEEPDEEDDAEVDEIDEDAFDGPRRLTAQERIRELVQEKNTYKDQLTERTKALEDLVAHIAAAEKAQTGYVEVDRGRIDRQLADLTNLATSLEAGGRYHDAAQVRGEINKITAALAENNRRQRTSESQRQARLRAQQHHQR